MICFMVVENLVSVGFVLLSWLKLFLKVHRQWTEAYFLFFLQVVPRNVFIHIIRIEKFLDGKDCPIQSVKNLFLWILSC